MYTEEIEYDNHVLPGGYINVRKTTKTMKDGVEIARNYERHCLHIDNDVTAEHETTKRIVAGLKMDIDAISAAVADADTISEGETAETEAAKKEGVWASIKSWLGGSNE